MRDRTKVVIGLGAIWGLFAFGVMILGSFTLGINDSAPEIVALLLYGLTILPACILAIWFMRYAALWLIILSPITAFGFIYQEVQQRAVDQSNWMVVKDIGALLIVAAIPGLIGVFLFRDNSRRTIEL